MKSFSKGEDVGADTELLHVMLVEKTRAKEDHRQTAFQPSVAFQ